MVFHLENGRKKEVGRDKGSNTHEGKRFEEEERDILPPPSQVNKIRPRYAMLSIRSDTHLHLIPSQLISSRLISSHLIRSAEFKSDQYCFLLSFLKQITFPSLRPPSVSFVVFFRCKT